jgi:hypothetical protein
MQRLVVTLLATVLISPAIARAQTTGVEATGTAPRRRHHVRRDRWRNTISLGLTTGAGGPLGVVGGFLEYRPIRWVSASVGAGLGGSFGPAVGGTLYVDPIVTKYVSIGIAGSYSHNFSWRSGEVIPGRPPLPAFTNWLSAEVDVQIRPTRGMFLRLGFGRAFMLDTQSFRIGTEQELDEARLPRLFFSTPIDAMYAAARNEDFGVWFVHLDIATVWRL